MEEDDNNCDDTYSDSSLDTSGSGEWTDEDEFREMFEHGLKYGFKPYQYEPVASPNAQGNYEEDSDEEHGITEDENSRLQNRDWCQCDNCELMDSAKECVCCKEITAVMNKCAEVVGEPPSCITQHPGFSTVCLNIWVLQTAGYQYKQQYNEQSEGNEHKRNRDIAYRQLARWCWGSLGHKVRVVLPSCAVRRIEAHFPPPGVEENIADE